MTKPIHNREDWENRLRLGLDDLFEDLQSYTGPNIDEDFTRTYEYMKSFIKALLEDEKKKWMEEVRSKVQKIVDLSDYPSWGGAVGVTYGLIPKEKVLKALENIGGDKD